MNLLEVKGATKKYKEFTLNNISFALPKGYIMGYVGQNGAGKTTTIRLITHICNANAGEIHIDGMSYEENPIRYKEMIGFVGDESYFPLEFSAREVRTILKDFYPSFRPNEFDELLQKWNIPKEQKIGEYSKGMKVKLMFATVFARDSKLLILDEATSGLDPVVRKEILDLLQEYVADGEKSILFSTHILDELEQIADYITFIDHGSLIISESKDDLMESYIIVKGESNGLTSTLRRKLIGMTEGAFGFEALIKAEDVTAFSREYVIEKPTMNQLMIHLVEEGRGRKA